VFANIIHAKYIGNWIGGRRQSQVFEVVLRMTTKRALTFTPLLL